METEIQNEQPDYYAAARNSLKAESPDPEFTEYLQKQFRHIENEQKKTDWLIRLWVTFERRWMGVTISDLCGYFSPEKYKEHLWTDVTVDPDKPDIHPLPIVKPVTRANNATMLQADSAVVVKSRVQDARKENGAAIGQKISDFLNTRFWNENIRALLFDMMQKNSAGFRLTEYCKDENSFEVKKPKFKESNGQSILEYLCEDCGESGEMPSQSGESIQEVECPACSSPAFGMLKEKQAGGKMFAGYETFEAGDIKSELLSPFYVTVDLNGTQGGILKNASFVKIHKPITRGELELEFPHIKFNSSNDLCYALKCYLALQYNDFDLLWSFDFSRELKDDEIFQKNDVFLTEKRYGNYVAPKDFEFRDKFGKVKFYIKAGQTIKEAQIEQYGHNPKGFRFIWIDNKLVDIITPNEKPVDHRKTLSVAQFTPNSTNFWALPFWELVQLNDDLTNLNTIRIEFYARNSVSNVAADSEFYDLEDFGNDIILTKEPLGNKSISNTFKEIPAPRLDNGLEQQMSFLWNVKDEISGVTAPMRGVPQPGQPAAAQRLQKDSAQGNLTPPLKSYAQMKCTGTAQDLELVQQFWTVEQYSQVGAEYGEQWTEEDIKDFTSANIEREFSIEYRPGSEMPQSLLDREIRFRGLIADVKDFMATGVISPSALNSVVRQLTEFANTDIDLSASQQDERLATMRFRAVAEYCKQDDLPLEVILEMRETVVQENPETGEVIFELDIVIKNILMKTAFIISVGSENHDVHIEFYRERVKTAKIRRTPNHLLIAVLEKMIELHRKAKVKFAQDVQKDQLEASQPAMEEKQRIEQQKQLTDQNQKMIDQQQTEVENEKMRQHQVDLKLLDKANDQQTENSQAVEG